MVRRPCSECGTVDVPKYRSTKNRGNGRRVESMASYCVLCQREKRREYLAKTYKQRKIRRKAYMAKWEKKNRAKRGIYNARYRKKIKEANCVEWYGTVIDGYTRLTHSALMSY